MTTTPPDAVFPAVVPLAPGTPDWPTQLDELHEPPETLYWLGSAKLRILAARSVAIVGSRDATDYGRGVARDWAAELACEGWTVVSGGAFGIDRAAHAGALAVNGATIAVLAGGVDVPYPSSHAGLLSEVSQVGGLVSEAAPGSAPRKHLFLQRNRLIAALTRGTVVVEAGFRSGALSTARHAAVLLRPVMAVPGPVTSPSSAGTNRALQDRLAFPVTCPQDVIDAVTPLDEGLSVGGDAQEPLFDVDEGTKLQEVLRRIRGS